MSVVDRTEKKDLTKMSSNKNSLGNLDLRSRFKKYDSYQPRNGMTLRRAKILLTNNTEPVKYNQKSTVIRAVGQPTKQTKPLGPKSSYFPYANLKTKKPQTHKSFKSYSNSNHIASVQKIATTKIAMVAVATAQIYENEQHPDNETTLYGTAKHRVTLAQRVLYGFAALILVFSAFVSVQSFITNQQAKKQIATLGENSSRDEQGVAEGTGSDPVEDKISESAIYAFQPPDPRDPRFIRIPELGVLARVKNLGITPDGAVDAPKNINDAGWYNGSARPGSSVGSSLLLGHVSGWTAPGIFKQINRLIPGSQFEVEKGNGEIIKYRVTKSEKIPLDQVDMAKILGTEVAGEHDIKLMTCSGRYNSQRETYEDRFVVYATQIK
jgi:hypothetical protein